MKLFILKILVLALFLPIPQGWAAEKSSGEEETLYDSLESDLEKKESKYKKKKKINAKKALKEFETISDLAELAPFDDIAVISKKYLPKTKRFEISLQGMVGLNNAFFNNLGVGAGLGWYLTEKWGIELSYYSFIDSERGITKNLRDDRQIETRSFVLPNNFYGASLKWSPMYGKMAFFEDKIVSFDWYFSPGIGYTTTEVEKELTYHIGVGQLIAINKSWAFRWDVNWNYYQATVLRTPDSGTTLVVDEENHSDLFLSVGVSFFFPEVGYR